MRGVSILLAIGLVSTCGASGCSSSSSSSVGTFSSSSASSSGGGGGGGSSGTSGTSGGASSGSGGAPLGETQHGVATYYAATGAGDCSFDATPNDLDVAAMNANQYATAAACGECVNIHGPSGSVTVRIVDKCPDCDDKQLDLSKEAFAKIAAVSAGRVTIDWQVVSCNVTGNVSYFYKDGSSQYWTAIQVRHHKLPIAKLEIQKNGAYVAVNREDYNYFVDDKGAGTGPVKVRITSTDGQTLEDTLPAVKASTEVQGAGQFH